MSVSEAFQAIFAACLAHLEGNRNGVLRGENIEYVHQMRVAIRRLRSALKLFTAVVPEEAVHALDDELRWLGGRLGEARDWDVFIEETLPPRLAEFSAHAGMAELARRAAAIRLEKREAARAALRSARCRRLLAELRAWIANAAWRNEGGARLDKAAVALAAKLLSRRHQVLRKRGRHLSRLPPPHRHRARIAAKKLRYAVEFFLPLFPGEAGKGYVKRLSGLQDLLGSLNDAAVTHRLLADLGSENPAAKLVGELVDIAAADSLAGLDEAWGQFRRCRPFWKK
jgi:triphosphatase